MRLAEFLLTEEFDLSTVTYYNNEQLKKAQKEADDYTAHHLKDGWEDIKLESPPENDSDETKDELVTITNIQEERTDEDDNSIHVSDQMDAFHFFEYMNANNIDYRASEVSAIINDVWKVSRIFKNMYNRPRPYQIAEAYNMDFDTMHGESNKTPAYPSGHSCGARLVAEYLSKKYPEHKDSFLEIAEKIGMGRIKAGFHYPSDHVAGCLLYTSPSPRDTERSRMPSSA